MASSPQTERLSVAVIGLGAIGGVADGCLVATGRHDVVACVRTPIDRLTLDAPDGTVELPLTALTEPAQAKPVDWVLLCTKTHATAATAPWLKRLCTPATRVAVLQNGIDHAARQWCHRAAGDRLLQRRAACRRPRQAAARRRSGFRRRRRRCRPRLRGTVRRHAAARTAWRRLRHAGVAQAFD